MGFLGRIMVSIAILRPRTRIGLTKPRFLWYNIDREITMHFFDIVLGVGFLVGLYFAIRYLIRAFKRDR
jgi:hypothetical protein